MAETAAKPKPVFVLVHGAWHGGWCWRRVEKYLRSEGYDVYTPTFTGMGEREHLLGPDVGLETFIQDVIGVIETEDLEEVVLVGHSFAGCVITGVADRIKPRLRQLIYLDSLIIGNGESPFDPVPKDIVAARREAARQSKSGLTLPAPLPEVFGVVQRAEVKWMLRKLSPHPVKTYEDKLVLKNEIGNGLHATYIACTNPDFAPILPSRARAKEMKGWVQWDITQPHDAMLTAPADVANLLLEAVDVRSLS